MLNIFFYNYAICEIILKNVVQPEWPQMRV